MALEDYTLRALDARLAASQGVPIDGRTVHVHMKCMYIICDMSIYLSLSLSIYIYIYREREKERERERDAFMYYTRCTRMHRCV